MARHHSAGLVPQKLPTIKVGATTTKQAADVFSRREASDFIKVGIRVAFPLHFIPETVTERNLSHIFEEFNDLAGNTIRVRKIDGVIHFNVADAKAIGNSTADIITLPEAALVIGPDGLQRIEATTALVPRYGRNNIFEADSMATATGMLDKIRKTHTISIVVNATGSSFSSALATGIGPARIITLSPTENAGLALQDV